MEACGENVTTIKQAEAESCKNLNRDKMFTDLWWLQYCICRGVGVGNVSEPFCGEESRNFCMHGSCELIQVGDPFCQSNVTECCITSQCRFPKAEGSPTCVCFNKKLAGAENVGSWKQGIFKAEYGFDDQFWLTYLLCAGVSVHGLRKNNRPLFGLVQKQLCIKRQAQLVQPIGSDGDCMSGLGTQLCFWSHCQFPPAKEADTATPCIACFNMRWKNKDKVGKDVAPMSYAIGQA